jgi:Uma2 family endonuclease
MPTLEEMLEWERRQPDRYEYVGGVLRAMVGGTLAHNTIIGNIFANLRRDLQKPCRAFIDSAKVVTENSFMYPDVVVTCETVEAQSDTVPEPLVIFEVLSKSTQDYDQGSKWLGCQTIESLQHFALISQEAWFAMIYNRDEGGWRYRTLTGPDGVLALPSIGVRLPLADIYEDSGVDP